jgi:threonine dehydrogenase-like Zn-dependent dehydrogenase
VRALTVQPRVADSLRLDDIPEPPAADGTLLAQTLALGICGTDREIIAGEYGVAPPGRERLVLGHESLGRVLKAPPASGFAAGDLVVGIVRHPDSCPSCRAGEWDMCRDGGYTEHGIKQRDGFGAERVRLEPAFAVRVDAGLGLCGVLLEPASVLAKAFEQVERIGARAAAWQPRVALVTGAGPIGLLAALLARQRGLEVHVYDRHDRGVKPQLAQALGAHYHAPDLRALDGLQPDIVIECTGASKVVLDMADRLGPLGILCLTGVSSGGRHVDIDVSLINRALVLENNVVFGTVNANRRHYEAAARALAAADRGWLERLLSRRVPLARWPEAFERRADDVKVVIEFAA